MKIQYEHTTPAVSRIHTFTLTIGHDQWKEEALICVRENGVDAPKRFEWVGEVDLELLSALQMSSDDLQKKLIKELKKQ